MEAIEEAISQVQEALNAPITDDRHGIRQAMDLRDSKIIAALRALQVELSGVRGDLSAHRNDTAARLDEIQDKLVDARGQPSK